MHYILVDDNSDALDLMAQQFAPLKESLNITALTLLWPNTLKATNLARLSTTIERLNQKGLYSTSEQILSIEELAKKLLGYASNPTVPIILISDLNMGNIGLVTTKSNTPWKNGSSDLRKAIAAFVSNSKNALFLHSSSGDKEGIAKHLGGESSRVFSLKNSMEREASSKEAKEVAEEIEKIIHRLRGNRLERLWNDPRTKDWFTKANVVPHETGEIKNAKAYKDTINTVLEITLPDEWFESPNLPVIHEALKGLCGAYFHGRGVEPTESVNPDKGLRIGSVVLIAMLAYFEKTKTIDVFAGFQWDQLRSTALFSNASDKIRVRLQGIALYEFFFYALQTDKHNGSLQRFESLSTGYGVKAVFSWKVSGLHTSCITQMNPCEGELTLLDGTRRSGKWIQYSDKPGKTTPALQKLLHAVALEPCTVFFGTGNELYITAIL